MKLEAASELLEVISFVLVTPQFLPPERVRYVRVWFKLMSKRFNAYISKNVFSGPKLPKSPLIRLFITMLIMPVGALLGLFLLTAEASGFAWILGYHFSQTYSFFRSYEPSIGSMFYVTIWMAIVASFIISLLTVAVAISTEWRLFCAGAVLFGVSKAIAIFLALRA